MVSRAAVLACRPVQAWTLIALVLGMAIFLEGVPYFIAPRRMRIYARLLSRSEPATLRWVGLAAMATGLAIAWLATLGE